MTREEAINWIRFDIEMAKFDPSTGEEAHLNAVAKKVIEAQEMAIEALEQPDPCEDAVSRAFMYELGATCIAKPNENGNLIALGRIDMLPPVTPKRKTGKWMIRETAYDDTEAKCSECGFVTLVNEPGNGLHMLSDLRFCPNCGAKMEGEQ